ncbi:MAG: ATP-binding cassette domain-containing protein [Clostridia bacterium]|nr:ATP-binding cassette domain-containing protein [Clostridia bacterium]
MTVPLIETRNLKKYFNTPRGLLHAVDNINIKIMRGETLGLVGESGCGKSTLGRVLLRLISATDGEVLYNGENILEYKKQRMNEMRKKMQIIFQDPYSSLNPRMSVASLIEEPLKVCGICANAKERNERVDYLMRTVGLAQRFKNSYPHELDGGRRQRIGVARALSVEPELIVCDEPVSALDVSIQAQILNLLMDLQEDKGLTYIFITHDLSVVKHISTHIMVMYLGQGIEYAEKNELFANYKHPYTEALLSAIPLPSIRPEDRLRNIIAGEVTSPINPKPGCRFAPRCPYAKPECQAEDIPYVEVSPNHFVACLRYRK